MTAELLDTRCEAAPEARQWTGQLATEFMVQLDEVPATISYKDDSPRTRMVRMVGSLHGNGKDVPEPIRLMTEESAEALLEQIFTAYDELPKHHNATTNVTGALRMHMHGSSTDEIAAMLGVKPKSVVSRRSAMLQKIRTNIPLPSLRFPANIRLRLAEDETPKEPQFRGAAAIEHEFDGIVREYDEAEPQDWQKKALCAQTDPEAFFPEKGESTTAAKKVCLSCEVRQKCLEYALQNDERFGVWGGLSERERRKLKKTQAA